VTHHDFLAAHRAQMIGQLLDWVRVPSVAGVPERDVDVVRSARWLAGVLRETGFPTVEVWEAGTVYADWCAAPGACTVLVYSHHDVRAAKDEQWQETQPFTAVLRDGRVYGRGASDAKGQVLAHIWGLRSHLAATGRAAPAVNVKFLIDGAEETGSRQLAALLDRHRVHADLIVFSDTQLWHRDHPAVCVSLRGMLMVELEVFGPLRDVHSGVGSGATPNPATELCRVLGRLHDDKHHITLPGFYDSVKAPDPAFAELPYDDADWLERSATRGVVGEVGYGVLDRLWSRPSIEVLSLVAGDPVGAARGAIPAVATATLTIHTVADQSSATVAEQLRRWVDAQLADGFRYTLSISDTATEPYRTPAGHWALGVLAEAMAIGFDRPVGRMGNGGGGPAELLARKLDAPVVFFGTGLPEDRWHDSDESVAIDVLLAGAATLAAFWTAVGPGRPDRTNDEREPDDRRAPMPAVAGERLEDPYARNANLEQLLGPDTD
jgi:acetylornithine deacetylase/succinyl-diaminopimelate desuccinylase-like protein